MGIQPIQESLHKALQRSWRIVVTQNRMVREQRDIDNLLTPIDRNTSLNLVFPFFLE